MPMDRSTEPDPSLASYRAPRPSFVDVFAGCGGLSLGLKRAGWNGLFAVERDPFAFQTLATNFLSEESRFTFSWPPTLKTEPWRIQDLLAEKATVLTELKGKVDLLAGGPPCQGFSAAGRRKRDDPRNHLFQAYLELVRLVRPKLVLLENVRGFTADFKTSGTTPGTLNFAAALRQGLHTDYDLEAAVLRAVDFGVPQVRPRFFLVGALRTLERADHISTFFDDLRREAPSFLSRRRLPRWPTARDALSDLEATRNGILPSPEGGAFESIAYGAPRTPYQRVMRDGYDDPPGDTRLARHRPHIRDRFAAIIRSSREEGRLNITISRETRERHKLKKSAIRVLDPLKAAPTITSLPDDLLHYSEPRTLTVRETARLQTFPDWFSFRGNYTSGGHRRRREVPRFTQVANAVPPLLAEQFGRRLLRLL